MVLYRNLLHSKALHTAALRNKNKVLSAQNPPNPDPQIEMVSLGPVSVDEVRKIIADEPLPVRNAAEFLAKRVQELQRLGISSEVDNQDALIPVLAADMKRKDQKKPDSDQEKLSDDGWRAAARLQIEGNKTTALTTSDDRYTSIRGGEMFDELHEFIHICSAPGGESELMKFNSDMNEGAINYFSELTSSVLKIPMVTRYPNQTRIVRSLVELIGSEGEQKLFAATFRGDMDGFFNSVGKAYVALGNVGPNGKSKAPSMINLDATQTAEVFREKVENWNYPWLIQRLHKE